MPTVLSAEQLLDQAEFDQLVQSSAERVERERPLIYADMVPVVTADENEVMARFTGAVSIADIITDDAEAVVQYGGQITLTQNTVPNFKHGRFLSQNMLNRLVRLRANQGTDGDRRLYTDWMFRTADELTLGLKQRRNWACVNMMLDAVSYNRFGVQISGTWGKPADLKVNAATDWDDHTNGVGITDILTVKRDARFTHGLEYDGMILSSAAFFHLVQQAEFKARLAGLFEYAVPANAYAPEDPRQEAWARSLLGLRELQIDDATFTVKEKDGTNTTTRYLPLTKVILYRVSDKGNENTWDFANTETTESLVRAAKGEGMTQVGPHGYWTSRDDYNPPDLTYWAVQRGWPRYRDEKATAVLSTGSYTE